MQRWIFGSDSNTSKDYDSSSCNQIQLNNTNKNVRPHLFRVLVNQKLEANEQVAVTGECGNLGNWLPSKCVRMNRENGEYHQLFQ